MMRVVTSVSFGGRRRHVAVTWAKGGWFLQTAHPTAHGYRYDAPHAGPFKTKKIAAEAKARLGEQK